jgi:fibronectin type 3 domain-containing protein
VLYTDASVLPGSAYDYRVAAVKDAQQSAYSNVASVSVPTIPAAPANLTVTIVPAARAKAAAPTAANPQVTLTWDDAADSEAAFVIERSVNGGPFTQLALAPAFSGTGSTSFVDVTTTAGNAYAYKVAATNVSGSSAFSNIASISIPAVPTAPTGLAAVLQGWPSVILSWTDTADTETGFVIERAANGGAFAPIATAPAFNGVGLVSYTDATVLPGSGYTYRVMAVNLGGASAPSNTAGVAVPAAPAAPNQVRLALAAGPKINLTFADNATNETGFYIHRKVNTNAWAVVALLPARAGMGDVTWSDPNVVAGSTYAYRVVAINNVSPSAFSPVASLTLPAAPAAPLNVRAANSGSRTVIVTWQDASNNETGFTIERATNASFTNGYAVITVAANTTSYTFTGLRSATRYYFRIRANNGAIIFSGWVNAAPFPITTK